MLQRVSRASLSDGLSECLCDGLSEYLSDGLSEYLCDGLSDGFSDRLPDACMQVSDGISHPKLRETVSLIAPLIASDDLADELADGVALSLSFSLASRCVAGGVAAISLSRTRAAEPRDGLLLVPVRRVQEPIRWPRV